MAEAVMELGSRSASFDSVRVLSCNSTSHGGLDMSTFDSHRSSVVASGTPTTASRRSSVETTSSNLTVSGTPASTSRALSPGAHRRNRAALRDYYNLRSPGSNAGRTHSPSPRPTDVNDISQLPLHTFTSELDSADFDARHYVDKLLETSSLSTVLKAENTLVSDIRTLDGEQKALVYDNYSKLIRAVETIGTMRKTMEERGAPLTMTKTLVPAVGFVAETAGALIKEGEDLRRRVQETKSRAENQERAAERDTVKYALNTPDRLRRLLREDKREEAEKDWEEIKQLLEKWDGVKGVAELRAACEEIMHGR